MIFTPCSFLQRSQLTRLTKRSSRRYVYLLHFSCGSSTTVSDGMLYFHVYLLIIPSEKIQCAVKSNVAQRLRVRFCLIVWSKQSSCGLGWVKSESSPTVTHYTFVILCIIVNNNSACMFLWFLSSLLLLLLLFLMPQKQKLSTAKQTVLMWQSLP